MVVPLHLLVIDDDQNKFTLEGPMIDDTPWHDAVRAARAAGRNLRCFLTKHSREITIRYQEGQGKTLYPRGSIIAPPLG